MQAALCDYQRRCVDSNCHFAVSGSGVPSDFTAVCA